MKNLEEAIKEIKRLSANKLNFEEDIERILSVSFEKKLIEELENLSFQAKYISGLISIIQRKENFTDESYFNKIKLELTEAFQKLKDELKIITEKFSPFIKNIFEEKYFQLTSESLKNLNRLCEDLTFIKLYLNDLKYKNDS